MSPEERAPTRDELKSFRAMSPVTADHTKAISRLWLQG